MTRRLVRLAAAVVLTAAAGVVLPASIVAPAKAAMCAPGSGVSVVVDTGALGAGVRSHCVSDGGGELADDIFAAAGEVLTFVNTQPGMVCQVDGIPETPCQLAPPPDKYWGLWWADGSDDRWIYATRGVGSLRIPDGASVAFAWQDTGKRRQPQVAPVPARASATASAAPAKPATTAPKPGAGSSKGTKRPGPASKSPSGSAPAGQRGADDPVASGPAAPTGVDGDPEAGQTSASESEPGADPGTDPGADAGTDRGTDAGTDRGTDAGPSSDSTTSGDPAESSDEADSSATAGDGGGVPTWVVLGLIAVLGAAAAVLAWRRRRAEDQTPPMATRRP